MSATGRQEPLVTVVTPFYNSAEHLADAIESVLAQTYGNFEYILANNCSTDDSLAIARQYAARDPRIKVHSDMEFLDQDANYNRAMNYLHPDSRYVKVVQADDRIYPRCLEEMVQLALDNPNVGIVGCCFLMGNSLAGHGLPFNRSVFTGREACRTRLLHGGTYFGSPTCLLYRADIVRDRQPFYRPDETNADTTACFEILEHCDFARVPQILCVLRQDDDSVSHSLKNYSAVPFLNYALLVRYGPVFLTPAESAARTKVMRDRYIQALARNVFRGKAPGYWKYQEKLFKSLGEPLPRGEIARWVGDYLADKALNPRQTLRLFFESIRRSG